MLAKKYKLPVESVRQARAAKILRSPNLTAKQFVSTLSFPRFGVVISKKTAKKAVTRNKLKRSTLFFFKEYFNKLPIADYLLIITKEMDQAQLKQEISTLFKSLKPNT